MRSSSTTPERSERAGEQIGRHRCDEHAEVRSDQGRLDEAEAPAREALRVFRAAHYSEEIATDCSILGRALSRAGRHEEAEQLLTEAIELAESSGAQLLRVGALGFLAEDLVLQGDGDGALATLERALAQADRSAVRASTSRCWPGSVARRTWSVATWTRRERPSTSPSGRLGTPAPTSRCS